MIDATGGEHIHVGQEKAITVFCLMQMVFIPVWQSLPYILPGKLSLPVGKKSTL